MFPNRYFAARFFADRFFPVGADASSGTYTGSRVGRRLRRMYY